MPDDIFAFSDETDQGSNIVARTKRVPSKFTLWKRSMVLHTTYHRFGFHSKKVRIDLYVSHLSADYVFSGLRSCSLVPIKACISFKILRWVYLSFRSIFFVICTLITPHEAVAMKIEIKKNTIHYRYRVNPIFNNLCTSESSQSI